MVWVIIGSVFSAYSADHSEQPSGLVEIVKRNSTFEFHDGILKAAQPVEIVIPNQGSMSLGFTPTLLADFDLQVESNGVATLGKRIKGTHINPWKTALISFLPNHPENFTIRGDLHPNMKGEFVHLSIESK